MNAHALVRLSDYSAEIKIMHLDTWAFQAMGTHCELQLYAARKLTAMRAAEAVIADVARLEERYSRYRDTSLLSQINRVAAAGSSIEVDRETAHLLDYAATCYSQSEGLFDITSGVLRHIWDFRKAQLPSAEKIAESLQRIGWHRLDWQRPMLKFNTAGMELDLGGVVKEYAADRAATICHEHGINHGLVNLGGDIRVVGTHPDGSPWRVGIRHPQQDGVVQTLDLYRGALASSGDYERCITVEGRRYGHVLNPLTGWPVRCMAAVSVLADFCVVAGSASTIGMLKEENGKAWLQDLGLPHLWVDIDGKTGGSLVLRG